MKQNLKTAVKCKNCAYQLGLVKTLFDPCQKCVGRTSIFAAHPTIPADSEAVKRFKNKKDYPMK